MRLSHFILQPKVRNKFNRKKRLCLHSGPEEAVLQVQLKPDASVKIGQLKERLRRKLPEKLPGVMFSFGPGDIVSRVMSFGSPTPIEVAVNGPVLAVDLEYAQKVREQLLKLTALRAVDRANGQD